LLYSSLQARLETHRCTDRQMDKENVPQTVSIQWNNGQPIKRDPTISHLEDAMLSEICQK
jgi:hypothetical protein